MTSPWRPLQPLDLQTKFSEHSSRFAATSPVPHKPHWIQIYVATCLRQSKPGIMQEADRWCWYGSLPLPYVGLLIPTFFSTSMLLSAAQIFPWNWVILEKLIVPQLVKKFLAFYELEFSLQCLQEPAVWPLSWVRSNQSTPLTIFLEG